MRREITIFYTRVLGMRLVKKTVNQDDVSAYHLFYADSLGSAGTDVTFFDWAVGRERRGTNSIVRTGLRVADDASLQWWIRRFETLGVKHGGLTHRDGRAVVDFEDPEGQRLNLVEDGGSGPSFPWDKSDVPARHQIRGLGSIVISVATLDGTDRVLQEVLGMRRIRTYGAPSGECRPCL